MLSIGNVIEAHHADISRDVEPSFPECVQKSERHVVIRSENRREIVSPQEFASRTVTEIRGPIAQNRRIRVEICAVDLAEKAAHPGLGLDPVLWPREVEDLSVTELDQVTSRHTSPRDLVDREGAMLRVHSGLKAHVRHI